jgi:hypothetical protein
MTQMYLNPTKVLYIEAKNVGILFDFIILLVLSYSLGIGSSAVYFVGLDPRHSVEA